MAPEAISEKPVRMAMGTKMAVAVVGTLTLAVLSSVAALVSAWRSRNIAEGIATGDMPEARAVAELEISLLEQRGFVASYVLSGDQRWMEELGRREPAFTEWLDRVRKLPRTPEERAIVARLDRVFTEYDEARNEVIALHDRGNSDRAREFLLSKVNPLYHRAYRLCENLVASTGKRTKAAVAEGRRELGQVSVLVLASVVLTLLLGAGLLWFFFRGILRPLRRMAEDAEVLLGLPHDSATSASPRDELRAIGAHLRTLMFDVEQTRGRLMNAEKLASVGKLAACVAHEIRNPLTSLKMRLFAITREMGTDPLYEVDLSVMSEEIERLESVIRNFLEFARPPALKPQWVDVRNILDKTMELVRHRFVEKDIRVEREGEEPLPDVLADPQQMKQVFINLLVNAVEATGEGGVVRITTRTELGEEGAAIAIVQIRDSGGGIPEDARERVFEPFFSRKDDGTGLGLSIAARIMARHGGRLELQSTGREGTAFAVHIPVSGQASPGYAGTDEADEQDTGC
jgi:signal transduction histidine kinase